MKQLKHVAEVKSKRKSNLPEIAIHGMLPNSSQVRHFGTHILLPCGFHSPVGYLGSLV